MINFLKKPNIYTIFGFLLIILIGGGIWVWQLFNESVAGGQIKDYVSRAEAATAEHDYRTAFENYQLAQTLETNSSYYVIKQADVAFMNGDYKIAVTLYRQANILESAEISYYNTLLALEELNFPEALIRIEGARAILDSERPLTETEISTLQSKIITTSQLTNLPQKRASTGKLLIEHNSAIMAKTVLEKLVFEEPDYRDAHYLLGVTYFKLGDVTKAKESLTKSLLIDPNYEPANTLIEQLGE